MVSHIELARKMTTDQRKKVYGITDHFQSHEFLPPEIFDKLGNQGMTMIAKEIPILAEFFRSRYGSSTINTYITNEKGFTQCGLRLSDSKVGAPKSSHKQGEAIDLHCAKDSLEIIADIKKNYALWFPLHLTEIEEGTKGWNHLSCRETRSNKLTIIPFYK